MTLCFTCFQIPAADQTRAMQDQMSGPAMAMPPDPKQAFKVLILHFMLL